MIDAWPAPSSASETAACDDWLHAPIGPSALLQSATHCCPFDAGIWLWLQYCLLMVPCEMCCLPQDFHADQHAVLAPACNA